MKRADPRVKLLWVLLCTTGALVFFRPMWMLGLTLFSLGGTLLFGVSLQALGRRLRGFLPLALVILALHILFVRAGNPLVIIRGYPVLYSGGVMRGATTLLRFFVILCSAAVMARENTRRVLTALTKLGISYLFSFMLMIALRFIPSFSTSFSDALIALQLRGVELKKIPFGQKIRLYKDLVLPVVADAVVKSKELAIVMEARGFGALPTRTSYLDVRMTFADWVLTCILFSLGLLSFGFYYLFG